MVVYRLQSQHRSYKWQYLNEGDNSYSCVV